MLLRTPASRVAADPRANDAEIAAAAAAKAAGERERAAALARVEEAASSAIDLCADKKLPILVFNYKKEGNIEKAIAGHPIGTLVTA